MATLLIGWRAWREQGVADVLQYAADDLTGVDAAGPVVHLL
jgi:hypothetical protein